MLNVILQCCIVDMVTTYRGGVTRSNPSRFRKYSGA